MRNGSVALVMCSVFGACAMDPLATIPHDGPTVGSIGNMVTEPAICEAIGESLECDSDWPSGACEDRCYEIYLNDIAECKRRLPPSQRPPCYDRANQKHGECRKRCNPREPDGSRGFESEPSETVPQPEPSEPFPGFGSDD
jgi:hypothetical protein